MNMNKQVFDIIILGGGLVGLTAANLCALQGLSVALVEAKNPDFDWPENSIDIRCSAISRSSQKIFESLDIWQTMKAKRVSPYQKMFVWDAAGFGEIQFTAREVAEPDLGHIVENRVMIKALWEKALEQKVTFITPAKPTALSIEPESVFLELQLSQKLEAKLIVGADGGRSWLRETAKFETIEKEYHQYALVVNVTTELSHERTAWQRFLPEGPLAFLPLSEPHTSSIVWTATKEKINALIDLPETSFCEALAHALDYRLGKVLSISTRQAFPLKSLYAKQTVADRVALIGDAAHVIHPLAGQGVNLGLSDAKCLVEILVNAKNNHYDIGHYLVLRKYERARRGSVKTMMAAMEFFKQTFGSSSSFITGIRSIGLNTINRSAFIKKQIIMQALG